MSHEIFVGIANVEKTDAETLETKIENFLVSLGLNIKKCHG